MKVTQICIGKFHHFHLARQMERVGVLREIWTGYPHFKLKREAGIPPEKIRSFPWFQTPYMAVIARNRLGLRQWHWLSREWAWQALNTLDHHVAARIRHPAVVIGISGTGLFAGRRAQAEGGRFVCDRGSAHICFQDQILTEEYSRWGLKFDGIDPRIIKKECEEYACANQVTVPSEFARRSFVAQGVPAEKIKKIPYGADLGRFQKMDDPAPNRFGLLWVGAVSLQKGFLYVLEAFEKLQHPRKEFVVIGNVDQDLKQLLAGRKLDGIRFLGHVPNSELARHYSRSHVFVLGSVQEGLAMVQGEALACGCPVIATTNTGAEDLFTDGVEGFIVPIRSSSAISEKLELLCQDPTLRERMAEAAILRVRRLGGWQKYGDAFAEMISAM